MTIEDLAKEYANRHLDVSEELGNYLVKAVFLDGAEYQIEKQDEFAIEFAEWKDKYCIYYDGWNIRIPLGNKYSDGGYSNKELLEIYKKEKRIMTLKEKFEECLWAFDKSIIKNQSEKCEAISDEFTIVFAEWCLKEFYTSLETGIDARADTMEELLEIYKKEKGL